MVLPIVLDSSRWRRIAKISDAKLTFYFMLLALAVYELTPRILVTRDTLPSSLWALNVLENHTLYFDNLRDSSNPIISGYFPFVQTANGHLSTIYPFGVGLITLPFYAIADLGLRLAGISVDLNDAAFEPLRQRLEHSAAALIAAICVGLYFRALTRMFARRVALLTTGIFAFATGMWSSCAVNLWQQGSLNLLIVAALLVTLAPAAVGRDFSRLSRDSPLSCLLGCLCGLMFLVRPTALVWALAFLLHALWRDRREGILALAFAALVAAPGVFWNCLLFRHPLGGYVHHYEQGLPLRYSYELLFNQYRGLFAFSPVLLVAIPGFRDMARESARRPIRLPLLLSGAACCMFAFYASYPIWHGGFCYGPRYLLPLLPLLCLLTAFRLDKAFSEKDCRSPALMLLFGLLLCGSIAMQLLGVTEFRIGSWSNEDFRTAVLNYGNYLQALQARPPGSRPDLGDGGAAAIGHPQRLQGAGGQGTGALGDGPGHRCGQGPRRAEELNTVLDPAAGHFDVGGDSDRHLAGDARPGPDERVLPHRLPGLGGDGGMRGAPLLLCKELAVSPCSEITQDRVEVLCTVEDANHRYSLFSHAVKDLMSLESGDGP